MKTTTKFLLGAGAAIVVVGAVMATPIVGLTSPFLAAGKHTADIEVHGSGLAANGARFHIRLDADGPAASSIQDVAINAGGHNGWHAHPGMVVTILLSGSITWYDENCNPTTYNSGDAWVEGSAVHAFRVTSATPIHIMAYFLTAQGVPVRTDEPAPACAESLGL
ncbi:MAG: cupin domain-containing protein [Gammaproteobacteria bacterium]